MIITENWKKINPVFVKWACYWPNNYDGRSPSGSGWSAHLCRSLGVAHIREWEAQKVERQTPKLSALSDPSPTVVRYWRPPPLRISARDPGA